MAKIKQLLHFLEVKFAEKAEHGVLTEWQYNDGVNLLNLSRLSLNSSISL